MLTQIPNVWSESLDLINTNNLRLREMSYFPKLTQLIGDREGNREHPLHTYTQYIFVILS